MKKVARILSLALIAAFAAGASSCDRGAARDSVRNGVRNNTRPSARIEALRASVPDKQRKEALARVATLYEKATFHHGSLEDIAEAIALSDKNIDAVLYAAELVSRVGFHTVTILEVAIEASKAALELPEFRELVELAVLKGGDHDELVALAERAALADSPDAVAELRIEIAAMREGAAWKTVDEAVAAVEDQQESIEDAIRERLRRTR